MILLFTEGVLLHLRHMFIVITKGQVWLNRNSFTTFTLKWIIKMLCFLSTYFTLIFSKESNFVIIEMRIGDFGLSTDSPLDPECTKKNIGVFIFMFSKCYNPINNSQNFHSCSNIFCSFCVKMSITRFPSSY